MSNVFEYKSPIIYELRSGESDDPYIPFNNVPYQVINNTVLLSEIPVEKNKVQVRDSVLNITYYEVIDKTPSEFEYIVDYVTGIIKFNLLAEGKTLQFTGYSRGNAYFPADRIWTQELNGSVVQTLGDIIEAGEEAIVNLGEVNTAITNAQAATSNANIAANNANSKATAFDNAESLRVTAENSRVNMENTRISSESTRTTNETGRVSAESGRVTSEDTRVTAESTRSSNESSRTSAETTRQNNESTRQSQESTRQSQENTRQTNTTDAINSINSVRDSYVFDKDGYDPVQQYVVNNQVYYNGSTYICIQNSLGNLPTNTSYWRVFASKGLDGQGAMTGLESTSGDIVIAGTTEIPDLSVSTGNDANQIVRRDGNGDIYGVETSSGAQTKANQAENNANSYTDSKISTINSEITAINNELDGLENEIGTLSEDLKSKTSEPITLSQGVQIVQGGDVPAILHPTISGRTLINLLGRDGNCEDTSKWSVSSATLALEPTDKVYGLNSIKITSTASTATLTRLTYRPIVDATKYYVALVNLKNSTFTSVSLRILRDNDGAGGASSSLYTATSWGTAYVKLQPSNLTGATSVRYDIVANSSATGQICYVDGARLIEITQAEYNALGTTLTNINQIAAKYPYVDDMKHINAVYMVNPGKNLLPPFSDWALQSDCNTTSAYEAVINATVTYKQMTCVVNVKPNTDYVFSATHNASLAIYDGTGLIAIKTLENSPSVTFNSGNYTQVMLIFGNGTNLGTFSIKNPMLNIGSSVLPFEPQKFSYLYLPDVGLKSSVDGNVSDKLYTDFQGIPRATRMLREMLLDGSLTWLMGADSTGYKDVFTSPPPGSKSTGWQMSATVVKHNGKVFPPAVSPTTAPDQLYSGDYSSAYVGSSEIALSIADTDSGWAESWTSLAGLTTGLTRTTTNNDMISAYFNGWIYDTANNRWYSRYNTGVTSNDVDKVSTQYSDPAHTPYRLMYQLAQSVDEPVNYEGSLMLHEGANQVEVGTGIVVREVVSQVYTNNATDRFINVASTGYPLKRRVKQLMNLYISQDLEKRWYINNLAGESTLAMTGLQQWKTPIANYDPTATYSTTYIALDSHALGIPPTTISAEYAPNIRESVESLVREVVEARTEASILRNTKAQKQPPQWIAPTLVSGWVDFGSGYTSTRYIKEDDGFVTIKASLKSGAIGSPAFYLPEGYRPLETYIFMCESSTAFGRFFVYPDGRVIPMTGTNATFNMHARFKAEQ